jgi:Mn-dependent DtxR family transcriptional regulator
MRNSEINYLLAIYEIEKNDQPVRCIDIANKLNYSKASVSRAIDLLCYKMLISKNTNRKIVLTNKGKNLAGIILKAVNYVKKLLIIQFHNCKESYRKAIYIVSILDNEDLEQIIIQSEED